MDKYLNKKTIGIITIIIIVIAIGIYMYKKDAEIQFDTTLIIDNKIEEKEESKDAQKKIQKEALEENTVVIHISGAVQNEGVLELKEDSRISNAIEEAGGLKANANLKEINLASKVEDGMKIYIPNQEEVEQGLNSKEQINQEKVQNNETIKKSKDNETVQKVNINTASQTQLETIPGIGPSTALKIITYRKEEGKFKSIEQIKEVSRNRRSKI